MRVNAINNVYCTTNVNQKKLQTRHYEAPVDKPIEAGNVSFQGKIARGIMTGLGAAVGGFVGFAFGGPVGAAIGASIVGKAGYEAQKAEEDFKKEHPGESWFDESDYDRMSRYD